MKINTFSIKNLIILIFVSLLILIVSRNVKILDSQEVYAEENSNIQYTAPNIVDHTNNFKNYNYVNFTATVRDFDKRIYVLDQYFLQNKSPLYGTAKMFVDSCTKYNAPRDCTTVVAIAMNETHLCNYNNSAGMHNCWGFGGPAEYRVTFPSFEAGIDKVTEVLAKQYGPDYMIDPSLMENTFCGSEPGCQNWGDKIKSIMDKINDLSKNLGMGDLFSLR